MILYIKGADFSSANIGTLSTYVVRKSMGVGLSHDIPNFISRKAKDVVWTVELSEGYIFGEYSITMGTSVIEPSVEGNVMTITIPVVTDNINITINSEYVNNGDDDEGGVSGETTVLIDNIIDFTSLSSTSYGPTQGNGGSSFVERCNIEAGKYVDYVDFFVIAPNKSFPSESVTIPDIKLYFVNAETETVEELVYSAVDQSSVLSDTAETQGYQILRCPIKRIAQKNTHLGITINDGYTDYASLYTIPYVSYSASTSKLPKPYFGGKVDINTSVAGKSANYYCPLVIYGY